ncbi:MAG: FeoA domain-containing protein [Lachnospiraceae bacterium]|nr:FeoA domain-containing protein [Lachnospiraceae bacterium]MDE6185211.1 FeoA domain-containing protein [Lachnospiraceae bacterium]
MSLFEGIKGANYEIKGLYVEEGITRRLQALGLNDGTIITVLNRKKNGALIIRVRGTRLAIGRHISQGIEVEESEI